MCNRTALLAILAVLVASSELYARSAFEKKANSTVPTTGPAYCASTHNVGGLALTITNYGVIGDGAVVGSGLDCYSGTFLNSCEYPIGSRSKYLYAGAYWIGAVVGTDTLVSVAWDGWQNVREFNPDQPPQGSLIYRSTLALDPVVRQGAVSEQDFLGVCTDTFETGVPNLGLDWLDMRPHIPLEIEITQNSYAWSIPAAQDCILFDCYIKSIRPDSLRNVYLGLFIDGDVMGDRYSPRGHFDDIAGFMKLSSRRSTCPPPSDSIPVAWIADNDGDLDSLKPCPAVTGVAVFRAPSGVSNVSFNWIVSNGDSLLDYGPGRKTNARAFHTGGTGTPEGDRNKYYLLSNGEIDFNQVYTSVMGQQDSSWLLPAQPVADSMSLGRDARYLLSFGPFSLGPGDSVPFTYAYVAGNNLHHVANNLGNLPANPDAYMANLDFTDFIQNVRLAYECFDNPGVDTDGDGYAGMIYTCWGNEMWFTGDYVPDFRPEGTYGHCCIGYRGNADGSLDDLVDLQDLTYVVYYLTKPGDRAAIACYDEANTDGLGIIDLSDLSVLITYLTSPAGSFDLPLCP